METLRNEIKKMSENQKFLKNQRNFLTKELALSVEQNQQNPKKKHNQKKKDYLTYSKILLTLTNLLIIQRARMALYPQMYFLTESEKET